MIFVHLDTRATIGNRALYVHFTCAGNKDIVRKTELELPLKFPYLGYTKYYNVPIQLQTKAGEDSLMSRYFPNYKKLMQTKKIFDPSGLFDQTQGIRIHDEL